jgi:hypothetical protein
VKTLRFALLAGLITGCHIDQLFTAARSGNPGGSTALVFMSQPHDVAAGVAMNPVVQVQAVDGSGNPLTTFGGAVTIAIGTNPSGGALKTTITSATPVNGIATFADVKLDKVGSGYTLTAAASGARTDTSKLFAVTPGVATQLSFTVQPASAAVGLPIQPPVQVTAYDLYLNQVTTFAGAVKIALGQNPKSAHLSGTMSVSASSGVATFTNLSLDQVGTGYTLIASLVSGSSLSIESAKFNITSTHKAPAQLEFVNQPTNTQAGTSITPPVGVATFDSSGNNVPTDSTSVSVALGANPGGATLSGTRTVTTVNGFAFFGDLSVSKPDSGYTLTATSAGLTGATSSAFTVTSTPVVATTLVFLVQPHSTQAGSLIAPVQVLATNNAGSPATTYTGSVTIVLGALPGGAILSGPVTVSAAGGVATFSGLSINKVGTGYTLTATASLLAGALSAPFDITPASKRLAFLAQPHTTQAGSVISPAVQVVAQDSTGTATAGYTGAVTIAFAANPGGAVLGGTLTVNAVGGVATFGTLTVSKAGTGYMLGATSGVLTAATSTAFEVTAAPPVAKTLVFTAQPQNALAGSAIAPPVQVTARDSLGILVATYTGSVTVAIATNPSGGTLSGTSAVNAVNGVATFSTLSVDKAGTGYTLAASATAGGLTPATSAAFNVTTPPPVAKTLAFTAQPGTTRAGLVIAPAVQVTARDSLGSTVTSYTGNITLTLSANLSGGLLSGTSTVAAVSGVATFSTLSVDKVGTGYTLTPTATGLTGPASTPFNVTP